MQGDSEVGRWATRSLTRIAAADPDAPETLPRRVRRRLYAHGGGAAGVERVAIGKEAGRVIGRRGAAVRGVEAASGARLLVLPNRHVCLLAGPPAARTLARELVAGAVSGRGRPGRRAWAGRRRQLPAQADSGWDMEVDNCQGLRAAHVARQARLRR